MGAFRITIHGAGDHRNPKFIDGLIAYIKSLSASGFALDQGDLVHWPDSTNPVYEDLLNGRLVGAFPDPSEHEKVRAQAYADAAERERLVAEITRLEQEAQAKYKANKQAQADLDEARKRVDELSKASAKADKAVAKAAVADKPAAKKAAK